MRKLLILLLLSGCATMHGTIGERCLEDLVCEKDGMCVYNNEKLGWYCVNKADVKPGE